jgi:hypothetical protein
MIGLIHYFEVLNSIRVREVNLKTKTAEEAGAVTRSTFDAAKR